MLILQWYYMAVKEFQFTDYSPIPDPFLCGIQGFIPQRINNVESVFMSWCHQVTTRLRYSLRQKINCDRVQTFVALQGLAGWVMRGFDKIAVVLCYSHLQSNLNKFYKWTEHFTRSHKQHKGLWYQDRSWPNELNGYEHEQLSCHHTSTVDIFITESTMTFFVIDVDSLSAFRIPIQWDNQ